MTRDEAIDRWRHEVLPGVRGYYESNQVPDYLARLKSWCAFLNDLNASGQIALQQCLRWEDPPECTQETDRGEATSEEEVTFKVTMRVEHATEDVKLPRHRILKLAAYALANELGGIFTGGHRVVEGDEEFIVSWMGIEPKPGSLP